MKMLNKKAYISTLASSCLLISMFHAEAQACSQQEVQLIRQAIEQARTMSSQEGQQLGQQLGSQISPDCLPVLLQLTQQAAPSPGYGSYPPVQKNAYPYANPYANPYQGESYTTPNFYVGPGQIMGPGIGCDSTGCY